MPREQVLTPGGFIGIGKVRPGMVLRTPGGGTAAVARTVTRTVKTLTVRLSDGVDVVCAEDDLWYSKITNVPESRKVRTTAEIAGIMERGLNVAIPLCGPLEFDGGYTLKVKPYTFGAITGDGCTLGDVITVTKRDMELFERMRSDGYTLKRYYEDSDRTPVFALKDFHDEKEWFGSMGLRCRGYRKYIPSEYKYASIEDRTALLQGLMDTDGYVDVKGTCSFTSTSRRLAKDVQWLVRSLGGKSRITSKIPVCTYKDGTKKKCRRAYVAYIQMPDTNVLFSIPRKKERCRKKEAVMDGFHPARRITDIIEGEEREYTSIVLDSADGLYIAGDFVVRHALQDFINFS